MIYGLFQFYNDELASWNRILDFLKGESGELVRQIAIVLDQQAISPVQGKKESNSFIDQFTVQQQEFDHIINRITGQRQRLDKTAPFPDKVIEYPICYQQDSLRARMQSIERNFMRTKYTCSIFLASFFAEQLMSKSKIRFLNIG